MIVEEEIVEEEATRIANPGPGARYELLTPIASGGMATVYVGRQFGAGGFQRIVAIKRMHPHIAESPELTAMFRDEARIASLIHHPNVVTVLDVYEAAGEQLLVMDFVDGVSLSQLRRKLRKSGLAFPPQIALRILVDALRGLHAAHEQKDIDGVPLEVVHRDATPQNILIGTDGSVKVTDFGIARAAQRDAVTSAGQAKGKFAYMAPEQCAGGVMDRRVDVFAIGVVLWELLVGRPLFRGPNDAVIISQITSGRYKRPIDVRPQIPKRLDAIVMQALSPAADERFPTAAAFADAIEAFAPSLGGLASSDGVGRLVSSTCGERVQERRYIVHEVIGGRRPTVPWGGSITTHGTSTGSRSLASSQSVALSTHHGRDVIHDPLEPVADFRPRTSALRFVLWIAGGGLAAVLVVGIFAWIIPNPNPTPTPSATSPPSAGPTPPALQVPKRVSVRIEADREIVNLRVPAGDHVQISGKTATFTVLRGKEAVPLHVHFDDGSEITESVVPTANAVIKVRSASASIPSSKPAAVPKTTGAKNPPRATGKGPRFQDNPYE